jgi:hypothetical protein
MTLGTLMTPLVIRMMIVSDAATWSIAYDQHSDDHNIFIIQATGVRLTTLLCKTNNGWLKKYFYFFCKTHYLRKEEEFPSGFILSLNLHTFLDGFFCHLLE